MGDFQPGDRVTYWGNAVGGKYYGTVFTIQWKNDCGCRHVTYSIINDDGKILSQALSDSLRVV